MPLFGVLILSACVRLSIVTHVIVVCFETESHLLSAGCSPGNMSQMMCLFFSGPHVSKDVSMCFAAIEHTSCYQAKTLTNHCNIKSTRKGLVPKPMVRLTQIYFHWVMGLGVV